MQEWISHEQACEPRKTPFVAEFTEWLTNGLVAGVVLWLGEWRPEEHSFVARNLQCRLWLLAEAICTDGQSGLERSATALYASVGWDGVERWCIATRCMRLRMGMNATQALGERWIADAAYLYLSVANEEGRGEGLFSAKLCAGNVDTLTEKVIPSLRCHPSLSTARKIEILRSVFMAGGFCSGPACSCTLTDGVCAACPSVSSSRVCESEWASEVFLCDDEVGILMDFTFPDCCCFADAKAPTELQQEFRCSACVLRGGAGGV
jgi:hypothetical protein